ncbi:MAG: B12-binding domain-containing protein [Nitrosopumilaceae archaeon]
MAYIRAKKVKGDQYLYLVKSVWDSKKATSRQEIVKYLGKAKNVSIDDIPVDYRNNAKITAYVSTHAGENIKKNKQLIKKLQNNIFNSLTKGDLDKTLEIFEIYNKNFPIEKFYDNVLRPAMYKVGDLWKSGEISVATEHVASNIAHELVSNIIQRTSKIDHKGKVLVCTPSGEEHSLGCRLIESFLQSKGFRVFNLAPSAPAESLITFINEHNPDVVLVSITMEDNVKTGQRLVSKLQKEFEIPILIGGQAVASENYKFNGTVITEKSLEKIPKAIRQVVKSS